MKVAIVVFPGSNCDRDIAWAIKKISGYKPVYLWHKENEYEHLENETDREMKKWVQLFNQFDLYTKTDQVKLDIDALKEYYSTDNITYDYYEEISH